MSWEIIQSGVLLVATLLSYDLLFLFADKYRIMVKRYARLGWILAGGRLQPAIVVSNTPSGIGESALIVPQTCTTGT